MKKLLSTIIAAVLLLSALTACTENAAAELTSEELAAIINENGGEMAGYNPAAALDGDSADISDFMQWQEWDASSFKSGALSVSLMNVQAYAIAVVKPADGQKDTVLKYLADYQAQVESSFDNYLADQYETAKNAVTREVNGYIVFVMAENADSIAENIAAKL